MGFMYEKMNGGIGMVIKNQPFLRVPSMRRTMSIQENAVSSFICRAAYCCSVVVKRHLPWTRCVCVCVHCYWFCGVRGHKQTKRELAGLKTILKIYQKSNMIRSVNTCYKMEYEDTTKIFRSIYFIISGY